MENLFFTTTVHLSAWPPERVKTDPIELHRQEEAIAKMHRFCHEIYHIPITWITSYGALMKYGDILKEYCAKYGDEVGIMEYGIYSADVVKDKAHIYQGWVEDIGMERDSVLNHKEDEVPGIRTWYAMSYEEQKKAITHLHKCFEEKLGTRVTTFASPFVNSDTMKILKELKFECIWGTCWNYFCEGFDHLGSLPHPYYRNINDFNAPETCEEDRGPISIPWGTGNWCLGLNIETFCRRGPSWATNAMEYANRGEGLDKYKYFEKTIDEIVRNGAYNPFTYLPIQLEAVWMDEGPMVDGYINQYPDYPLRCTEVFYSQIEKCLSVGAKCVTQTGFALWHKEHMKETTESIIYSEDLLPAGLRINGKDREYEPTVLFANRDHQFVFSKSNGINYTQTWNFKNKITETKDKAFPSLPPRVQLQNNFSVRIYSGIKLSDEKAEYVIEGLDFSSYQDYEDYAGIIWKAHFPEYVNESNIKTEGLNDYRILRQDDIMLFFASMKEGDNHFKFWSDEPDKYIKIISKGIVGSHYEIWIENTGSEAELTKLNTNIGVQRKLGCFWWNGEMHRSVDKFDQCFYDQHTGDIYLGAVYPASFKLRKGLNRLTFELFD